MAGSTSRPVGLGGLDEQIGFVGLQQQAVAVGTSAFEQFAVEAQHVGCQGCRKATHVHVGPQNAQHALQHVGAAAVHFEQRRKRTGVAGWLAIAGVLCLAQHGGTAG
jgi:hypothetical protein